MSELNVLNLLASLQRYWSGAHSDMMRAERFYNQEYESLLTFDYNVPIYKTSTATDIVDLFRNQFRTDEPTVDFAATGPSREAQEESEKMRKWGRGMLARERERSEIDPNSQYAFDLIVRGAACKKIQVDVDAIPARPSLEDRRSSAWKEYEIAVATSWPYVSRCVDPLVVYPAPGNRYPLPYLIETQERRLQDMREEYPSWPDPLGATLTEEQRSDPTRAVKWVEYWSPKEYVVLVDGAEVIRKENPYGFVPYIYEFSGNGRRHADGDPRHLAVGILSHKLGELESEVLLKTAIQSQALSYVFPTLLTPDNPKEVARQLSIGPGRILQYHVPGLEPKFLNHPEPNPVLLSFLGEVKESISSLRNPALMGQRSEGVNYGILQAQLTGQAGKFVQQVHSTMNRMGGKTLNMMAQMARLFDLDMNVEGSVERSEKSRMVRGTDFKHFNFSVDFEAVDPAENDRMLLTGESMRRAGDISRRTFWKVYAKHVVPDADEEEANLVYEHVVEQLSRSGALMQIVLTEENWENVLSSNQAVLESAQKVVQKRRSETVPEETSENVRQYEALAGSPNQQLVPREIAENAMMEAQSG